VLLALFCWVGGVSADVLSTEVEQRASKSPSHPVIQQDDDKMDGAIAKFLWDGDGLEPDPSVNEAGNATLIASFLWDEADSVPQPSSQTAGYLWGEEIPEPEPEPEETVAKFLWDGDNIENGPGLASYLWKDDRYPGAKELNQVDALQQSMPHHLGQRAWREEDTYQQLASLGLPVFEKTNREYIVVANDFARLEAELANLNVSVIERFDMIRAMGVRLDRDQYATLRASRNVVSLMENHQVETASALFSAKGDPTLEVKNRRVSWNIHNLGNKPLNFETLELSWPAANGHLKKVKINDVVVFNGSAESNAVVEIDRRAKLRKNKPSKITLVFSNKAVEATENYDLVSHFKEGLTLEYAFQNTLPVQGRRRDTFFPTLIDADMLHVQGVTGQGVGVAIIDTGSWSRKNITQNTAKQPRVKAYYDAIENRTDLPMQDDNGHGTHIASVLASSRETLDVNGMRPGSYHGIAPDADLIIVKAFDEEGRGSYMNVIRAIAYVIAHKQEHNIRVLNLSFGATPMSHYWQDPLNLAVMAAWRAYCSRGFFRKYRS
jgi:subtilisin family serine protease